MTTFDRIKELLDRAGHPMMFVANEENHTIKPKAYATIAEAIDAYLKEKQRDDNDLIEQLTAVLENVLNERDTLAADLEEYVKRVIGRTGGIYACTLCKHYRDPYSKESFERRCPVGCEGFRHWEWRGVPDKEG